MIKGCHKSIVFLKDTGNCLFEEAFFVLKADAKIKDENDIVMEATKIVNGYLSEKSTSKRNKNRLLFPLFFFLGALTGFIPMLIIHLAVI